MTLHNQYSKPGKKDDDEDPDKCKEKDCGYKKSGEKVFITIKGHI